MTRKTWKIIVVLLVAAPAAAILIMYRPTLRPGPVISPHPLTISKNLEGARLHVFSTRDNKMSRFLVGDAVVHSDWPHSDDIQRIAVNANRAAVVRNEVRSFLDTTPNASIAYGHDLRGIDCERHDIVCHRSENFNPEGGYTLNP